MTIFKRDKIQNDKIQRQQNVYFDIGNVGPGYLIESQSIVLTLYSVLFVLCLFLFCPFCFSVIFYFFVFVFSYICTLFFLYFLLFILSHFYFSCLYFVFCLFTFVPFVFCHFVFCYIYILLYLPFGTFVFCCQAQPQPHIKLRWLY